MCHRTWAGGQARKREARPSHEPLPPGEGRGGTAAMGKSSGQGGGAARSATREDTAPQDVQHFHVAVGDQWSPNGQARSAWPNKGRGRLACPNPPCVSIAAPARGSRYSERGRGGSVPQLPQAAPGCPQALLCWRGDVTGSGMSPRAACDVGSSGGDWTVRPWVFQEPRASKVGPLRRF